MTVQSLHRHWLITAFEPFAGRKQNNSMLVLEEIKTLWAELVTQNGFNLVFHTSVLPVEYKNCFPALDRKVSELLNSGIKLEGILALGEGAEDFKLETQAYNIDDVPELSDNAGEIRNGKRIFSDFPENKIFPLRFPVEAFSRIRTSTHAGFFICNHLCAEMSMNYGKDQKIPYFGFIHVPKVGSGGMFTSDVCAAVIMNGFKALSSGSK